MSPVVDDHLERRISEHLDGELDDAQQAELFRALLRDPEARRLMDDYAERDRLAAAAIKAAVVAPPRRVDRLTLKPQRRPVPWGQFAATAAVLAMAVGLWFIVNQTTPTVAPEGDGRIAASPPDREAAGPADRPDADADDAPAPPDAATADTGEPGADNAVDRITGGADEATIAIALTGGGLDAGDARWWRQTATGPIENGRLVDRASTGPLIPGYQNARRDQNDAIIGVIDLTTGRMYWFKLGDDRVTRDAADYDL